MEFSNYYFVIVVIVAILFFIWVLYLINENGKLEVEILIKKREIELSEQKYEDVTKNLMSHIDLTKFKGKHGYISCKCPSLYGAVSHGSITEHKKICPIYKKINLIS